MTLTDQLKIIDNKIKANQAQYNLDRLAAKVSAYSTGDLRKYEYLTDEDLGFKPSVVNQDDKDFKIIINKRTYDLKNAKKFWMEVTTRKITKSETKLIQKLLIRIDTKRH